MLNIKERILNWLAGEDVGNLRWNLKSALGSNEYLRVRYQDLERRVFDRDNGVVPGSHRERGALPDARFTGIYDYGKGVTREEALTFSRVDLPRSGVSISVDDLGTATVTRDGAPIVVLPAKP